MAITRSQIARQLLAEGGVSLDDAKRMAPEGEFLAYINPKEAQMLKDAGGSGIMTPLGIPSFVDFGGSGTGYGSAADTFSAASGNPGANSRSDFGGDGGGNDPIQDQIQSRPAPKKSFFETVSDVGKNIAGLSVFGPAYAGFQLAKKINPDFLKFDPNAKPPVTPPGGDDNETQVAQPIMPIMPLVPKLPTDIEPPKSDMEFVQRFSLPERFRLAEGGDVSVKDAEKMAPKGEFLAYINDDEAALLKSLGGAGQAVNETGIPSFFVKKLFKKATKAVKKVVKSPIGKAALLAAGAYYAPGFGIKAAGGFKPFLFGAPTNLTTGKAAFSGILGTGGKFAPSVGKLATSIFGPQGLTKFSGTQKALAGIAGASILGGLAAGQEEEVDSIASRISDETGIDVAQIRKEVQDAYASGDISGLQSKYPFLIPTSAAQSGSFADGGIARLGYAEGSKDPVMDKLMVIPDTMDKVAEKLAPLLGFDVDELKKELKKRKEKADGGIARLGFDKGGSALEILAKEIAKDRGISYKEALKIAREEAMPGKASLFEKIGQAMDVFRPGAGLTGYANGGDIQKQAEEAMKEGFPRYTDEDGNEVSLEEFLKAAAEEDKKMVMPKRKPPEEVQKRKEKNFKKAKPALEKESADMVEDLIRSKKAGGGLMDLGGNEMDLRGGGFVPIGAKEKADDVPARLSKNEFVFTADAVRAAGGGSVEKGAQKMYNTMKQLEDSIA